MDIGEPEMVRLDGKHRLGFLIYLEHSQFTCSEYPQCLKQLCASLGVT